MAYSVSAVLLWCGGNTVTYTDGMAALPCHLTGVERSGGNGTLEHTFWVCIGIDKQGVNP